MDELKTAEVLTVFKKPFFVNELLAAIRPDVITPGMFEEMVKRSREFDVHTILTAMTRQVDVSGIIPNLVGVYDNAQDVLEALTNQGHQQLLKISNFDPDLQMEIFETLKGSHRTTLRALLVLDDCQREVVQHFTQIRQQSPLAMTLRMATEEALEDLYQHPKRLHSKTFDQVIAIQCRKEIFKGKPFVCYPAQVFEGAVVEVWKYFFMPNIYQIRLPKPYQGQTVGELLESLTPHIYRRQVCDEPKLEPQTPSGFMGLLGKVGGALPRQIALQVKKNEEIKQKVMREEETARDLYDFFTR
jgi:hypothetical protein